MSLLLYFAISNRGLMSLLMLVESKFDLEKSAGHDPYILSPTLLSPSVILSILVHRVPMFPIRCAICIGIRYCRFFPDQRGQSIDHSLRVRASSGAEHRDTPPARRAGDPSANRRTKMGSARAGRLVRACYDTLDRAMSPYLFYPSTHPAPIRPHPHLHP